MKNRLLMLGIVLSFIFGLGINTNAQEVDITTTYKDSETPLQERNETESVEEDYLPKTKARAALTIPAEGVYDTIKDTKNAAGVMTARSYYYKNKLVEKRTYTSTGSTDCRMRNKYLYFSNGSTVYIHRTYSNTKDVCYNLQTKRYNEKSQIQAHSIYEGKVNGKIIENRYYEITGTYYTQKAYYKNGIVTKREYWKGAAPNRITHTATYNSAGTEWIKAVYYHYPTDVMKEYITYNGVTGNNVRTTAKGYDEDEENIWYIKYNAKGEKDYKIFYEDGIQIARGIYYPGTNIFKEYIEYQEDGKKIAMITYRDTDNKITNAIYYDEDGNMSGKSIYDIDGVNVKDYMYENDIIVGIINYKNLTKNDEVIDNIITYKTEDEYSGKNIIENKSFYDEDGDLTKEIMYENDGVTESVVMMYNKDGSMQNLIDNNNENLRSMNQTNYDEIEVDFTDEEEEIVSSDNMIDNANEQELSHGLEVVEKMPESVINEGEDAVRSYLLDNGVTEETSEILIRANVIDCGLAIGGFILTNAFAPAKLLKLKKVIKAAGGATKLAKKAIKKYKAVRKLTKKVTTYYVAKNGKLAARVTKKAKYTKAKAIKKAVNYSAKGAGKAAIGLLAEIFGVASIKRGCFS